MLCGEYQNKTDEFTISEVSLAFKNNASKIEKWPSEMGKKMQIKWKF